MRVQGWKGNATAPQLSCIGSQLGVGSVHRTHPYHKPLQPTCQCVTRAILSPLFYLISTHQHQGSSLLAISSSHQSFAAIILCQLLSLSLCVFLLAAPSSTPLLQPTTLHHSPGQQAPDPQDPQLPKPSCPPAPAVLCMHLERESSKNPHHPGEVAWTTSLILPAA